EANRLYLNHRDALVGAVCSALPAYAMFLQIKTVSRKAPRLAGLMLSDLCGALAAAEIEDSNEAYVERLCNLCSGLSNDVLTLFDSAGPAQVLEQMEQDAVSQQYVVFRESLVGLNSV